MTAIPLASKSDPAQTGLVSGELLENWHAAKSPAGSETPFYVKGTSGIGSFYSGSSSLSRGLFPLINVNGVDSLLTTQGSALIELDSTGAAEVRGSVFGTNEVYYARNMKTTPQVGIVVPGDSAYIYESGAVTQITDGDLFENLNSIEYFNGYFLIGEDGGRIQGTSINEGSSIDALDFLTAEANPDGLRRIIARGPDLFAAGNETIEVLAYDEREDFPFVRRQGGVIGVGIADRSAIAKVGEKIFFVDHLAIPRRLDAGYTPQRIGNEDVEGRLREAMEGGEKIHVWGYLDGGHEFIVFGAPSFTWVWDNSLGVPHTRKTYRYDRWQARHYAYCFGKHLVASDISGAIGELRRDVYDEFGQDLIRTMRTPLVSTFPAGASLHELNLLVETGNGLGASGAAEDQNPTLMMRVTKDGYKTWSTERQRSLGAQGEYRKTVRFNRLGACGRQGVAFEFSASAAVANSIIRADLVADKRAA